MGASSTQTPPIQPLLRKPWVILISAMSLVTLAQGIRQSMGLYLGPVTADLRWTRETFSFAIALQNIAWGVSQPILGMIADRYGAGRVIGIGGILYAVSLFLASSIQTPLGFALSVGAVLPLALSSCGYAIIFGIVGRCAPVEKRSIYMALAASGGSVGQFMMVPITQLFIDQFEWRGAFMATGWLMLSLPLFGLVLAERDKKNQQPDAQQNISPLRALCLAGIQRRYWLLFAGFFVCGFHVSFIAGHFPAFLTGEGLTPGMAALCLALIGFSNIFGSIFLGRLGDTYSKRCLLSAIYLARAFVFGLLLLLPINAVSAPLFSMGIGFIWLATVPLTSGMVGRMYGVTNLSTLFGVIFLGHQIGAFLGVWLGGLVYDSTGSYQLMWQIAIGLGLVAAALHWPIDERSEAERQRGLKEMGSMVAQSD